MARTVSGRETAGKRPVARKSAAAKTAPNAKVKANVKAKPKAAAKPMRKVASPMKKAAARKGGLKKIVRREPVARRAAPQRARPTAAPRRKTAAPRIKALAPAQSFTVSHLNELDFKADGLRTYALYRDLGIAKATGGLCQAHVIRLLSPCTDEVRKRHVHAAELQLIYVLKGWVKNEFEGQGVQMMSAGSCFLQPPGIRHTVLDYSADVELLEIIVPADFKTTDLD